MDGVLEADSSQISGRSLKQLGRFRDIGGHGAVDDSWPDGAPENTTCTMQCCASDSNEVTRLRPVYVFLGDSEIS